MRHIVCRFDDEKHFARHLRGWDTQSNSTVSFLGHFAATAGDTVRVTLIVESCHERYELDMTITGVSHSESRAPMGLWRYQAMASPKDAVWLEMFISKIATFGRMADKKMPAPRATSLREGRV